MYMYIYISSTDRTRQNSAGKSEEYLNKGQIGITSFIREVFIP